MTVRIEKLVQGGLGLGRDEGGKVVLVEGALPGERVEAETIREKGDVTFARSVLVLEANAHRREPACPLYEQCGGCNLQHLDSAFQAQAKDALVKDNLRRIAHIEDVPSDPVAFGPFWNWRTRCRFHVDLTNKRVGFLAEKSGTLVPLDSCPVLAAMLNDLLKEKKRLLQAGREAMFQGRGKHGLFEVPCQAGDDGVSLGDDPVSLTVAGVTFAISASVFFQSNPYVLEDMASFVRAWTQGERVIDLYSGVGTLSAFAGKRDSVRLVERNPKCLALAKRNVPWGTAFTGDAGKFRVKDMVDTVLVDPPRVGLDAGVPDLIASWKPSRILYMSCNSVTLARDAARFLALGYQPVHLRVFDMYPQTWEQEAALVLDRRII